ncbi:MAG: hypothetical protein ACFFA1_06920 [Promethearchaeota archaeon]
MVDLMSVSIGIAAVSVVIGVVFAVLELRNVVKQRQTDLVMRLYSTFGDKEFRNEYNKILDLEFQDYDDYVEKHGLEGVIAVGVFFEGIGVLLHRKLIDIGLVTQLFRQSTKLMWERAKPIINGMRKQYDQPRWGEFFEYLYNEMQRREQPLTKI